jgi:hypothetical protein
LALTTTLENNMSSLKEMLDQEIAKRGLNRFMVHQLRNQIMASVIKVISRSENQIRHYDK